MKKGFATIFAVIIVSTIALAVVLSLSLRSLSESRISNSLEDTRKAFFYADSCVEKALIDIRQNDFVGSNSVTFLEGSCNYDIINNGGESRTIQATGTKDIFVRKIKVQVNQITPKITLSSWQEVSDF